MRGSGTVDIHRAFSTHAIHVTRCVLSLRCLTLGHAQTAYTYKLYKMQQLRPNLKAKAESDNILRSDTAESTIIWHANYSKLSDLSQQSHSSTSSLSSSVLEIVLYRRRPSMTSVRGSSRSRLSSNKELKKPQCHTDTLLNKKPSRMDKWWKCLPNMGPSLQKYPWS